MQSGLGDPFRAGRQLDPVQRHFPSLLVNVTCSLFLVAQLHAYEGLPAHTANERSNVFGDRSGE